MAHLSVSLEAAGKSIVLLKNQTHLLPLLQAPDNIAVVGPAADDPDALLGNYNGIPSHIVTPLQGIEHQFGGRSNVSFALGSTYVAGWTALVPENVLTPEDGSSRHGLRAEYFLTEDFAGVPELSRIEPRVRLDWEMQDPAIVKALPRGHFSVRWTGFLKVAQSGEYNLGAIRPECHACGRVDAAGVYLDGRLLIEDRQKPDEMMFSKKAPIALQAGRTYKLRIEYTQHGGGGGLQLVWTPPADSALREAVDLVKHSSLAILCVGLNSRLEGEESKLVVPGFQGGDRTDLRLPEPQRRLLQAVFETGKPVVVVLVNGSALAIGDVKEHASAVLETWYGGPEAGTALADTISGKNNPAGRLPVTFYASVEDLPPFTNYSMKNRTYRNFTGTPLFPFGYGLSYSEFEYSGLKIDSKEATTEVTATVRNSSSRDGDEVAQLYLARQDGGNPDLRGFERIHLKAGQKTTVHFKVENTDIKGRLISVGGGQPLKQWTGDHFVESEVTR